MKEEKQNTQVNNTINNPQLPPQPSAQTVVNNTKLANTEVNKSIPQNTQQLEKNVEVLDEIVKENPKQEKSSMISIFIIFGLLILFVIALPFITSYINNDDNPAIIDANITNVKEYNTKNGKIIVGEKSYIQIDDIKFYNFTRDGSNNILKFNIIADKRIINVNEKELYIELYNSAESLIYRTRFSFNKTLEKSIIEPTSIPLEREIYLSTTYAKILKLEDIKANLKKETPNYTFLTCTKEEIVDNEKILYKTVYTFNNSSVSSYTVNKSIINLDGSISEIENSSLRKEYEEIIKDSVTNNTFVNNSYTYVKDVSIETYITETSARNDALETGYICE